MATMENNLTIFVWICVIIANLEAKSLPSLSDYKIKYMREDVTCPSNPTFYAPKNVENCTTTALDCCLRELDGNVRKKCQDPNKYIDDAVETLNRTLHMWKASHPLTNSSQCACEHWPKVPMSDFLNKMESLLQLLYIQASS